MQITLGIPGVYDDHPQGSLGCMMITIKKLQSTLCIYDTRPSYISVGLLSLWGHHDFNSKDLRAVVDPLGLRHIVLVTANSI